ncbi:choice-of-anchor I family protein [Corynebacterium halotolerans]|uniref:Alkaline phosphatase n=1 Tax=Corynebacterium halotolerans YIM 70093 = DSM 44683 TaxID=1121362 RepID=M1NZC5_9CORY|nr:choice-of-anchor I family protein [Corynebacterium halotolerans]AGF72865.1 alkaline phosphatase [Corynebacterium halotolerans YIM 70093 = DSM 44683]
MSARRSARYATALCAAVATSLTLAAPAHAIVVDEPVVDAAPGAAISLTPIGSHDTGRFDESAAEIVAHHPGTQQLLVVNALSGNIDLLDISDPANPVPAGVIESGEGNSINSVAVRPDGLAVANVEPADKTAEGSMLFFDAGTGEELGRVMLGGALPDMVGISADGRFAFSANEGEPAEDYTYDPEGSVSVVTLPAPGTVEAPTQADVRVADFRAWNAAGPNTLPGDVRIFGQVGDSTTIAQNLEPEYITEADGKAYVTLQENNAVAVIDLAAAEVEDIWPIGFVDHRDVPLDASDRDGAVNIANWPVQGMPLPDAIGSYQANGATYLVTANEGDARDWDAYSEEARIKDLGDPEEGLPPICEDFAQDAGMSVEELQADENLGRLNITTSLGLGDGRGCFTELYSYGSRGFSIFDVNGNEVFTSGDDFEQKLAELHERGELIFNASHDEAWFDNRSDNKGPEPEGLALGEIDGRTYAFIGLERIGGIFVYDITDPAAAEYVSYVNNRDFAVSALAEETEELNADWADGGDLGPEGLAFIPAADSPTGRDLLAVGNEVSGSTTIFEIEVEGDDGGAGAPDDGSAEGSSAGSSLGVLGALAGLAAVVGAVFAAIPNALPRLQAELQQLLRF